MRNLSNVLLGMDYEICKYLTSCLAILGLLITHISSQYKIS